MDVAKQYLEPRSTLLSIAVIVAAFTVLTFFLGPAHFNGLDDERLGERLLNRLYYVMTTVSTVGYGDISPKSPFAKLVGITLMATMLATVVL